MLRVSVWEVVPAIKHEGAVNNAARCPLALTAPAAGVKSLHSLAAHPDAVDTMRSIAESGSTVANQKSVHAREQAGRPSGGSDKSLHIPEMRSQNKEPRQTAAMKARDPLLERQYAMERSWHVASCLQDFAGTRSTYCSSGLGRRATIPATNAKCS